MMRGGFITLEGTEGVGKSSCIPYICELIEARGHAVLATREPGGTALAEAIRRWILDSVHGEISAEVEVLLMFAARADHLVRVIRPALAAGQWVVCDRFTDATVAYQGGGRGISTDLIDCLRTATHGDLAPDLTLLFDAPLEVARARIAGRTADHFEREELEFFERVRAAYLAIADAEPTRVRRVDAQVSQAEVRQQVRSILEPILEGRLA
jgi:dTMP kinase